MISLNSWLTFHSVSCVLCRLVSSILIIKIAMLVTCWRRVSKCISMMMTCRYSSCRIRSLRLMMYLLLLARNRRSFPCYPLIIRVVTWSCKSFISSFCIILRAVLSRLLPRDEVIDLYNWLSILASTTSRHMELITVLIVRLRLIRLLRRYLSTKLTL